MDEGLVQLLVERNALSDVNYFDFADPEQLGAFIATVKSAEGYSPTISITRSNFVGIFGRWFDKFADKRNRRNWVDRFVIDLRKQYVLDPETGTLTNGDDAWQVAVQLYEYFWSLYKRPPESAVDYFISTNKDLLYDLNDRNDDGDFYTPLTLAAIAHGKLSRHLSTEAKRSWWDPAAGGGNLFMRFQSADSVILTTKFESDCNVLKGNKSLANAHIAQLDFITDLPSEGDAKWKGILARIKKSDEVVFFLNPPFDDQAESRGSQKSLGDDFIEEPDRERVTLRALRASYTRFIYRILCLLRKLNKKGWVAIFSKTGWIVGPDSFGLLETWMEHLSFVDGLIVSSRVFNGIREEWPCLFSVWEYDPDKVGKTKHMPFLLDVFDKELTLIGQKPVKKFDPTWRRFSETALLPREELGKRKDYVVVAPLKNEFEVAEIVYDDKLPLGAFGYLRMVANDVYNSQQGVQLYSSMCGPSNHNGVPIMASNFEAALAVYGTRKSIRRTWLNDKDEFYFPMEPDGEYLAFRRKAAVFGLVDGGYTSSLEGLQYQKNTYSLVNEFFIPSVSELNKWGVKTGKMKDSFASRWIKFRAKEFTEREAAAVMATKNFLAASFNKKVRASGDPHRQLNRIDASVRQIINGLIDFDGTSIPDELFQCYKEYLEQKELLRRSIEHDIYDLGVLSAFMVD